jgi:hypothetical protein
MTQQTNAERQAQIRTRKTAAYDALKAAAEDMGITITSRNQSEFDALLEDLRLGKKKIVIVG